MISISEEVLDAPSRDLPGKQRGEKSPPVTDRQAGVFCWYTMDGGNNGQMSNTSRLQSRCGLKAKGKLKKKIPAFFSWEVQGQNGQKIMESLLEVPVCFSVLYFDDQYNYADKSTGGKHCNSIDS